MFKNKLSDVTAWDFYQSVEDKESYYWKSSGVHTYNVLKRQENSIKKEIKMNEILDDARKLKFKNDTKGLEKFLSNMDYKTAEFIKKQLEL